MERIDHPLLRKIRKLLAKNFPGPDAVTLEDDDGIFGMVASPKFDGLETADRLDLIGSILDQDLDPQEKRQILFIVGLTPEEKRDYAESNLRPKRPDPATRRRKTG